MTDLTPIIGGATAIMVLCLFGGCIAARCLSAEYRRIMGEGLDPTGKENLP